MFSISHISISTTCFQDVFPRCTFYCSQPFTWCMLLSDSVRPHRWQPTRLHHPWDSPGKITGVGCHFLLQCMKGKSESEVAQLCPTLHDPMDCSPPGSSVHGIFQARGLGRVAIAFSGGCEKVILIFQGSHVNYSIGLCIAYSLQFCS